MDQIKSSLRHLPSVDAMLQMAELSGALESFGRASVTEAIRKGFERRARGGEIRRLALQRHAFWLNGFSICLKRQGNRACVRCSI